MTPLKSSLARSVGKLLGVSKDTDLSLRGDVQSTRFFTEGFTASGGNVDGLEPGNGYKYHTFTSPGTFTISGDSGTFEILMVGGGGAGGVLAGGGGAGGLVYGPAIVLPASTYTVTVGQGGAAPGGFFVSSGSPGTATTITNGSYTITANGGGGSANQGIGFTGGSGGGGCGPNVVGPGNQPSANPGVSGILQYGFPGGLGSGSSPGDQAGGGGGAGEQGHSRSSPTPAKGGDGRQYPAFTGPLIGVPALSPLSGYFAGGGGGGSRSDTFTLASRSGGLGGGGTGETSATAGVTNSGGGGGAGSYPDDPVGKAGGPGILIIRYPVS